MITQPSFALDAARLAAKPSLTAGLARSFTDIHEAQRLRYAVFAGELGARLHAPLAGVDQDHFDTYCHHLLVRDATTRQIVGYTRILTDDRAQRAGGFYSQREFDISPVLTLPGRFMEMGRTCVHPDYRNGATISVLWSGLAAFIAEHDIDYLIGCASIPLGEEGRQAQALYAELSPRFLISEKLRVRPLTPLPWPAESGGGNCVLPPLLKGYLRLGARIGGEPCLDPDFNVADLFILLSRRDLDRRYARHFLGGR